MFLGLIVFAILAASAALLATRAVRTVIRKLTGRGRDGGGNGAKEHPKDGPAEQTREESQAASRERKESPVEEDPSDELTSNRYAEARGRGITEAFSREGVMMEIDPATVADLCVRSSALTYLEFGNRHLAGEDYRGFNLIVEKDSRMVLTYGGQAVASITAVEVRATATVNGQEVEGTAPGFRINTFPPELSAGMAPSDLERMLGAADRIIGCGPDPRMVADCMVAEFTDPVNVGRLKAAVDAKIRSKESVGRAAAPAQKTARKEPLRLKG